MSCCPPVGTDGLRWPILSLVFLAVIHQHGSVWEVTGTRALQVFATVLKWEGRSSLRKEQGRCIYFALFFVDFLYISTSFFSGDRSSLLCRCVWFEMFFPDCSCLLYNMSYAGDIVDLIVSPLDTGQQTWTPNFQSFFPEKILSPALVTSSGMCRGKLTEGKFGPVGIEELHRARQAGCLHGAVAWICLSFPVSIWSGL